MDRRSIIKHAGIVGVLAAGVAPSVHAQATIRWRLASSFPKTLDTIYGSADVFAQKVSEMTGGKFSITVHPAGELMPAFGVVDGVQQGTVEAAHTAPYYFFGKDDAFALGGAIPFGMNSRQLTAWFYDGNGMKLFREFYDKYNIVNFSGGNTGAQMGGWYRKEIKGVEDLKGLKMRIGGFAGKVFARMGGVAQNIPAGEIYQALEKGTIDAAEWIGPYDDGQVRFSQPWRSQALGGRWCEAAGLSQAGDGSGVQRVAGTVCRTQRHQPRLEENLRGLFGLPQGRKPVVPLRRRYAGPLHAVGQAVTALWLSKTPRKRGFLRSFCSNSPRTL